MNENQIDLIIQAAKAEGREILTEFESKQILRAMDIDTTDMWMAKTGKEAADISDRAGFPVVMKIHSPDITHKSDAGCVKVNIRSKEEALNAYDQILANAKAYMPNASLLGVTVQPMATQGMEVIVGMKRDPVFGPAVLFGLGGIFVELLKDMSLRVYPFEEEDAQAMIQEIRGSHMLQGYRGQPVRDLEAIRNVILKIGALGERFEEIKEIDLNPIFAYEKGLCAVDARILIDLQTTKGSKEDEQYAKTNG